MTSILERQSAKPLLVVHIGGAKAGSTAIQDFLFSNRERLEGHGVAIPNVDLELSQGRADQIWFFENLVAKHDATEIIRARLGAISDAFRDRTGAPPRAILISAENLSNEHDLASRFEPLKDDYAIVVVLYIRRQEDAYQAAWQQWFAKSEQDIDAWLESTDGYFCDWRAISERWEAIAPDAFVMRIHDRKTLVGHDIVDDFCDVLGLDVTDLRRPDGHVNASFGVHVSELYRAMPGMFEGQHDLRVETLLYETGNRASEKRSGEWIFSPKQLQLIRKRHAEGNATVKARYFPTRPKGPLFPPIPRSDICGVPTEEINRRNIGVLGEFAFKSALEQKNRDQLLETRHVGMQERMVDTAQKLSATDDELLAIREKLNSLDEAALRQSRALELADRSQEERDEKLALLHEDASTRFAEIMQELSRVSDRTRSFEERLGVLDELRSETSKALDQLNQLLGGVHFLEHEARIRSLEKELPAPMSTDIKDSSTDDTLPDPAAILLAASALEADANRILNDKWWRRTRTLRKWSNSIRKRRGRPKKHWPLQFDLNHYLPVADTAHDAAHDIVQNDAAVPVIVDDLPEAGGIPLPEAPLAPDPVPVVTLPSPPSVSFSAATEPRCTVVAMARNEALRAHESMRHFCALFDRVVILDHASEDETAAIVAGYDGVAGASVHVLRADEPGYFQSEYMSAAASALVASGETDWVFFLDFDEFLPFTDRAVFHQALFKFSKAPVIAGHWINCALADPAAPQIAGAEVVISDTVSPYLKVALNARLLRGREICIEQGNHAVRLDGSSERVVPARAFGVFHLPIVTVDRLKTKLAEGIKAYDHMDDSDPVLGFHWRELYKRLSDFDRKPELLRRATLRYGESLDQVLSEPPPCERRVRLAFAQTPEAPSAGTARAPVVTRATLATELAAMLPVGPSPKPQAAFSPIYATLHGPATTLSAKNRAAAVQRAVMAGAQELDIIVPTAWAGHEPFLFSLMEAMRPRRYVELGTHAGQSFFTACQHYKSNGNYGEAVAIDLWEGDHQAGFYSESVFDTFRYLLDRNYADCGRYIRSLFCDAVTAFEPASIDLLHIDGLHTYSAVREDYETWRSRLTASGTILFHDTSEFQTDFGVWQLFEEVRREATASFAFEHSHGLGVLAFGSAATNPVVALLEELSARPALYERHYATLGRAMFRSAQLRYHGVD